MTKVNLNQIVRDSPYQKRIPNQEEIQKLADLRETYRQQKNWQKADEVRIKIQELGYQIEDTKEGPKIKKI